MIVYLIYELHNGVEPRLRTGYANRRTAYKKVEEWNNREKKEESKHRYYIKEFEVREWLKNDLDMTTLGNYLTINRIHSIPLKIVRRTSNYYVKD